MGKTYFDVINTNHGDTFLRRSAASSLGRSSLFRLTTDFIWLPGRNAGGGQRSLLEDKNDFTRPTMGSDLLRIFVGWNIQLAFGFSENVGSNIRRYHTIVQSRFHHTSDEWFKDCKSSSTYELSTSTCIISALHTTPMEDHGYKTTDRPSQLFTAWTQGHFFVLVKPTLSQRDHNWRNA